MPGGKILDDVDRLRLLDAWVVWPTPQSIKSANNSALAWNTLKGCTSPIIEQVPIQSEGRVEYRVLPPQYHHKSAEGINSVVILVHEETFTV